MLKRLTQKRIGVSMLFAVTLCVIASSLIVDIPFSVEESTAYREHAAKYSVCGIQILVNMCVSRCTTHSGTGKFGPGTAIPVDLTTLCLPFNSESSYSSTSIYPDLQSVT